MATIYNLINRLKAELYIDLNASKEILIEIAEEASAKIGSIKRSINAAALDSEIDKEYERLGERIYTLLLLLQNEGGDISDDPAIIDSVSRLHQFKRSLLKLEEEIAYFREEILIGRIMDLKDDLKKGSLTLEIITLPDDSPCLGVKLSELGLPKKGLIVVLIKRSDKLLIPDGMTELREGDLITLIGPRSGIDGIIRSAPASPPPAPAGEAGAGGCRQTGS